VKLFEAALADMKKPGAEIVEGIKVAETDEIPAGTLGGCNRFKHDLKAYLARLGSGTPVKSLDDILASQKFHPSVEKALLASQAASDLPPDQNPKCREVTEIERRLAEGVLKTMDEHGVDVLVFLRGISHHVSLATSTRPTATIVLGLRHLLASQPSPSRWAFPCTLPAGIQILGRPWSEPTLFKIAYSYEQTTRHRRSPASTPPLPNATTKKA